LVFIDESGLLLAPLLRRTWSPRACTPVLRHRTGHHHKVSVIAALVVSPARRRLQWYFRLHPAANLNARKVRAFVRQLRGQLRGALVLIWDRWNAHRSPRTQAYARAHRIHCEWLPPYAPELNPVEYGWSWLKTNPLANHAAVDVPALARAARRHSRRLQHQPRLLWSFIHHSPLPLRPL